MPGTNLLQTLTMPCNMTLTQSYETQRDLLTGMAYRRSNTLVTQRTYSYDTLGRPVTRSTARKGQTVNDSFVHNSRSELASATVNGTTYGYDYDNIGNRRMAMEAIDYTLYEANALNQYTSIQENEDSAFVPIFDADGNQTLVKTATGIWSVVYNAENRPIRFTSEDETIVIECAYDFMGRRVTKKVTTNGSISLHQRYIYRGYLQIACCDLTRSGHPCLWLLTWDPSQPVATRPLAIRKDGTWFAYGWDLTKNICEVFGPVGYIRTAYTYSPYGEVSESGDVTQPIQWSSEYHDTELALVYYNYRHYNPVEGRWIGRDIIPQLNLYAYAYGLLDILGLKQNTYGLPDSFWEWAHKNRKPDWVKDAESTGKGVRSKNCPKNVKFPKNPDVPKDVALEWYKEWEDLGRPGPDNKGKHKNKNRNNKDDDDDPSSGLYAPEEKYEPSSENAPSSTDENNYGEWGRAVGIGIAAVGIGIIVGTIVADVVTAGLSIADDPATISAGASMIYQGSRLVMGY